VRYQTSPRNNVTSLLIRDVDEALHQRLKASATAHGRSLVDEARELLRAAICEAEIRYGLVRIPAGHRRDDLVKRIDLFFATGFGDQILPFERGCARRYGEIRHAHEAAGTPISVEDAMIAATARGYGAAIATRNTRHFAQCGVPLIDPWEPA
jgi:predicted nucleic acid-binding protein